MRTIVALAAPRAVIASVRVCQGLTGPSSMGGAQAPDGAAQPASSTPRPEALENDFSFKMGFAMK
jgi:hypothetical protein